MGSKSSPGRDSASSGSWKLLGLLGLAALGFVAFTPAAAPPEVDDPSERRDPRAAVRRDIPAAHSLRGRTDADVAVPPPDAAAAAMASAAASELPQTDLHALGYAASAGERFLAAMRERDGVVVLPSGLQYKVLRRGSGGFHPTVSSKCSCHYEGRLVDGAKFDSSYDRRAPTSFAPNQVGQAVVVARPPRAAASLRAAAPRSTPLRGSRRVRPSIIAPIVPRCFF